MKRADFPYDMHITPKFIGFLFAAFSLFIGGCAAPGAVQNVAPISSAASGDVAIKPLKIQRFTVKWIENPEFKINLERTMPTFLTALVQTSYEVKGVWNASNFQPTVTGIPESSKQMADAYIGEILRLYRENSADYLKAALNAKGVKDGTDMAITIKPLSGFQSIDGWGTNVLFRTEFVDQATSRKSFVDVMVKSGIHWTGVRNASKPTMSFVEQYIDNLTATLRDVNAF